MKRYRIDKIASFAVFFLEGITVTISRIIVDRGSYLEFHSLLTPIFLTGWYIFLTRTIQWDAHFTISNIQLFECRRIISTTLVVTFHVIEFNDWETSVACISFCMNEYSIPNLWSQILVKISLSPINYNFFGVSPAETWKSDKQYQKTHIRRKYDNSSVRQLLTFVCNYK